MAPSAEIDTRRLYRLPWNLADNAITWLEPTSVCNLACQGCYKSQSPRVHRPIEEVERDLLQIRAIRKTDGVTIAGGEPLLYPQLAELAKFIAAQGMKPVVNTNGLALTPELVRDLAAAGVMGFTIHIDSRQNRPGWENAGEEELNQLRLRYARMIDQAGRGRLSCSFNATVYPDTLDQVPALSRWARENIHLVQTMVFILYRTAKISPGHSYYVGGRLLDPGEYGKLAYDLDAEGQVRHLRAAEVVEAIRRDDPLYEPSAFLNSTEDPGAVKWLLSMRAGTGNKVLGYMDARFSECVQSLHHLFWGTYLAYSRPRYMKNAQLLFPLALFSKAMRATLRRWLGDPSQWTKAVSLQSVMIIQPIDFLPDGRQAMCDGCPDAIYHQGRLCWSCRFSEIEQFGEFIRGGPGSGVAG